VSRVPDGVENLPELTIVAREVLLDSLDVLADHAPALTVVGAQAIYLRSADVDLTVATFTSDADLTLDPDLLESEPLLQDVMTAAGFVRKDDWPGQWYTTREVDNTVAHIGVDLLIPTSVAGRPGKRGVDIPPHDRRAAGKAHGLEAALVDANIMEITSLRPVDSDGYRVRSTRVAGPAALFVAKAHKIAERYDNGELTRKDAGDVLRLMMATEPDDVARRFEVLLANERSASVAAAGLGRLRRYFGGARTAGTEMAVDALAGDPIQTQIPDIAVAYLDALSELGDVD
jgi:hypothetical protein